MSAALALTLALALTACDRGGDEATSPTPDEVAATTEDQGATATATGTPEETSTESPSEEESQEPEETGAAGGVEGEEPDDSEGTVEAPETGEATEPDDDPDDNGQDNDDDGIVGGGPAADLTPSALAAIETAVGQADGTPYQVDDREDSFWEVDVATDGGATTVTVAPDGTTVDSARDAEDPLSEAGRQALGEAQVSLAEAIVAAVQASEGQLDSAELAAVDDAWWWVVVVDSPSEQDIQLRVNIATGEVVANQG